MLRKAMFLIVLGLVVIVAIAFLYGEFRWKSGTRELRDRLEAAKRPIDPKVFNRGELESVPAPVQRYFRAVLEDGQPIVAAVSVEHTGTFNMGEAADQWKPFTSTQRVIDGEAAVDPGATDVAGGAAAACGANPGEDRGPDGPARSPAGRTARS